MTAATAALGIISTERVWIDANPKESDITHVKVGNPVFVEQLAASCDLSGPDPSDFVTAVSKIIDDMHADGTLTAFSQKWYGVDLTVQS